MGDIEHISDTALWVAAHRAIESRRRDALYRDPLAEKLAGEKGVAIARAMPRGAVTGWIMVVRTLAIDRMIAEAIEKGADTVINLGAGLDTRPYRLALPAALKWVEVDFPHLIEQKNALLRDEKPRCELRRLALDLSARPAAQALFAQLGQEAKRALVITEGVIPYLTVEQAGALADDLRRVPSFAYWIQDWRNSGAGWDQPAKLKEKLASSPFRFSHPDTLAFLASRGWKIERNILAIEEGERIGRPYPRPWLQNLLSRLAPQADRDRFRRGAGYVMLRAA